MTENGPADVTMMFPREAIEAIAGRAVELVLARLDERPSPWLTRAQAAEYLAVPLSRLEKDRRVPSHRWDGRVLYHRDELDSFVRSLDNTHP
jgi:hypothetical protein